MKDQQNPVLLLPNQYFQNNRIAKNSEVTYPVKGQGFRIRVTRADGLEKICAVLTQEPLDIDFQVGKDLTALNKSQATKLFQQIRNQSRKAVTVESDGDSDLKDNAGVLTAEVEFTTVQSRTKPRAPKRVGMFVGIDEYRGNISSLSKCKLDAKGFQQVAQDQMYIDEFVAIFDENATFENIKKAFVELKNSTDVGDEIVIFWSGHGYRTAGQDRKNKFYLVTHDADLNKPASTMLSEDEFEHRMNDLSGRRILIFLDACFSGGMVNGAKAVGGYEPFNFLQDAGKGRKALGQEGLFVMCSSNDEQVSWEGENLSVMTSFLIDAIRNGSTNLIQSDLKDKIKADVDRYVDEHIGSHQTVVSRDDISKSNPVYIKRSPR